MNVEKAVFVDVDVADVACEGCGLTAAHAHCERREMLRSKGWRV